jgi:hypothetical protein
MLFRIADTFARDHDLPMQVRLCGVLLSTILLGGCSYTYDMLAVAINGHLAFVVDPKSRKQPDCIYSIHVETDRAGRAKPTAGDDAQLVSRGVFWWKDYAVDACPNPFPILYGQKLRGQPFVYDGKLENSVEAKPLIVGVVYEVTAASNGSGYGGGRFRILPDRRIENLPREDALSATEPLESTGS